MLFPPPTPHSQFHALFLTLSLREKKKTQAYKQKQRGTKIHTNLYKNTKMENKIGK